MPQFKLDEVKPFPDKVGTYLRLVIDNTTGSVVQGHVLRFEGEKIIDLANGNIATPEVMVQGDQMCNKHEHLLVTYSEFLGMAVKLPAVGGKKNGVQPKKDQKTEQA